MIARISTFFDCTADELWARIIEPASLQFVASPILGFSPVVKGGLEGQWTVGKTYDLKISLFHVLPLGRHQIKLVMVNRAANTIVSNESGKLAPVWNHTIRFYPVGPGQLSYTDEIEIRAGVLTLPVWMFAHLFYRHRQRRWRILLRDFGSA